MSAMHKTPAPTRQADPDVLTVAYQARDMVREHLTASLALCDDVLAQCEKMKFASRRP